MTEHGEFTLIKIGMYIFPIIIFAVLAVKPRQISYKLRALSGVLISWAFIVLYTIYVYNPAGIAAGHEIGVHFPEANYDNNTISVALIGGWIYPVFLALLYLGGCLFWKKKH